MLTRVGSWILYFGVLGLIIALGWKEPLKYRFMSKDQVIAAKAAATPPPRPLDISALALPETRPEEGFGLRRAESASSREGIDSATLFASDSRPDEPLGDV